MGKPKNEPDPAAPVLALDKKVRKALLPYRETAPAEAAGWVSQAGDQLQLRLLAGGTIMLGLIRRDPRMAGAGLRMLAAHELGNGIKKLIKRNVVRERPRSSGGKSPKPRKGRDNRKEKSSFPSGHATGAVAVARAFAAVYPEHSGKANAAAATVSLARLPGCAHYPSDIAAGGAIGMVASGLVTAIWHLIARKKGDPIARAALMLSRKADEVWPNVPSKP